MELLFVTVIGAGIGALFRYLLPRRGTYGLLLLPAVSAAATAIVWVALVWLGWKFDGTWIWVASLGAAALAALVTAVLLPRRRVADDARRLTQLSGGKA
ncbi:MAG: hypothetical protein JWP85_1188 [Rhodoglobus sp.]|nr:hypothetical protein [Rhodoglobus sp.]